MSAALSKEAVVPLATLDPSAPLDDLAWLDEAIGDARVVAIGESSHYNAEFYLLRHRLLRYLVERHGFSAYALESGFTEGRPVDGWVRGEGGPEELGRVQADGVTSLMGVWTQLRDQLRWMRAHNATAARPVGFHGIDLGGSNVSPLPALDAVLAYLADADPAYRPDPALRETVAAVAPASVFSAPQAVAAFAALPRERKDALTAGLSRLMARLIARRLDLTARAGADAYERARHALSLAIALDTVIGELTGGAPDGIGYAVRDAAMADTVAWVLRREDRIVLAAHNGHLQRGPGVLPGQPPFDPMGLHLADRLGTGYLVIATTCGTGQVLTTSHADFRSGRFFAPLEPPEPGSLDALMAATADGPFATDLRRLSPADAALVRAAGRQRLGTLYTEVDALSAYDIVIHLPHVTPANPDPDALAHTPEEVRATFAGTTDDPPSTT
ncbi:erythromycin esterase family protein [Actinomadura sp. ATCC 31491]|uniref:Erythromycin esterase family protein n=1 Tax=Actinomadura luzonensis TaxID=2805427 RepID=A0ABT0FJ21_9ACTN|nr:erythromycin esterase family protein [Actinomadura luzonensis]MCK2212302.1 erythromycin esterase family protein [Actinomadura luzonensis]